MEPQAKVQTAWFFFLSPFSPEERITETKNTPHFVVPLTLQ